LFTVVLEKQGSSTLLADIIPRKRRDTET